MERQVRLVTGLTLFAYAACHFASHATGLFGLRVMDAVGRNGLLWPWQTWIGRSALLGSLFVHGGLGLRALYRRRHFRIPRAEAWQLGLGLSIPFLIIPHVANVRLGYTLYGLDDSYYRILYHYWIDPPWLNMARQLVLLGVVWLHGCLGLHFWLRRHAWYARARPVLLAAAGLLPALAVLGLVNAGWDTAMTAALQPGFAAAHGPPPPDSARALTLASLAALWWALQLAYLALLALVLAWRLARNLRARRVASFRVSYPDGRVVVAPRGFSVLEVSRWARVPHASICGGRGRCSTCRVRVGRGADNLPPPSANERDTLARVAAPPSVRLACQLRPRHDLAVTLLLPAHAAPDGLRVAVGDGRELPVTALFVDLRDSTRLAVGRLPFDALFIVDRYVQRITACVQAQGGHVTSVAGDGIMSVFGTGPRDDAVAGARAALAAAAAIWDSLDRLSAELAAELDGPLGFGMGLHSGLAAVGSILVLGQPSLQFLGDTGNVAARLEAMTKELDCRAIVSAAVVETAAIEVPAGVARRELRLRGREALPLAVILLRDPGQARLLADPAATYASA